MFDKRPRSGSARATHSYMTEQLSNDGSSVCLTDVGYLGWSVLMSLILGHLSNAAVEAMAAVGTGCVLLPSAFLI